MNYFFFIITILIVFSGCSSNTEKNTTVNGGANSNAPNTNQTNVNSAAATNSNTAELQSYNGTQNVNPNDFIRSNSSRKIVSGKADQNQAGISSRPAPDDSTITSGSRGMLFYEARTFKSNPVLSKVEKIMDGKTTVYKVYLKNGKVLDAPADQMTNYAALAPANILEIIGMSPKPPAAPQTRTDEKKEQKP